MKEEHEPVTIDVRGCARCHAEHQAVEFKPFGRAPRLAGQTLSHWAICPTSGEPILMSFVKDES